jgi:erythrocyte band 7 integral membrane protein
VEDAPKSTQLLAATTLRNVLGTRTLQEILAERESIAHSMQVNKIQKKNVIKKLFI